MSGHMTPHERQAREHGIEQAIRCAVLTISDTRTYDNDESGDLIVRLLDRAGHLSIHRSLVRDEPGEIERTIQHWIDDPAVSVILSTGGTGIGRRDTTIDLVRRFLTTELNGFGELFRMLSWNEVGAAAMLSRAVGGLVVRSGEERRSGVDAARADGSPSMSDLFIFSMPGSRNAVRTAMKQLILPQLPHLIWERMR